MIIPQFGWSQNHETHGNEKTSAATANEGPWKPINKFATPKNGTQYGSVEVETTTLTNVLNGVSFYSKNSICESEKIIVLKLINSNNYSVKVIWQIKPDAPKTVIEIPANSDFEGSCSVTDKDENKSKLIIKIPQESDKEEIKKYVFSHITVTRN